MQSLIFFPKLTYNFLNINSKSTRILSIKKPTLAKSRPYEFKISDD